MLENIERLFSRPQQDLIVLFFLSLNLSVFFLITSRVSLVFHSIVITLACSVINRTKSQRDLSRILLGKRFSLAGYIRAKHILNCCFRKREL